MSEPLALHIEAALGARVHSLASVAGGDINEAYAVTLHDGRRAFVKTHASAPSGMYAREAEGLAFLREAGALRVPNVLAVTDRLLALEWIEARKRALDFDERLGRGLAQLHRAGTQEQGFARDNFIALLPQPNAPLAGWADFYRERRLLPMLAHAREKGLVSTALAREFDALFTRLPELVGPDEPPARLHGDLWSGNVHTDERGAPVLIDPAVYGGHREIDLAMLRLFGAPSQRVFAAYEEEYPLAPSHDERVALYQLYPLLVHVCLFGASYLGPLSRALRSYA